MKNWSLLLVIAGLLCGCKSSEVTQPQVALPPEPEPSADSQDATLPPPTTTVFSSFPRRPSFSPDGKFLAYMQTNGEEESKLIIVNTDLARESESEGPVRASIPIKSQFNTQLFWSDDSKRIIGTGSGAMVWKIVESKSKLQLQPVVEYGSRDLRSLKEKGVPADNMLYHGANVSAKHQIGARIRLITTQNAGFKDAIEVFDLKNEKTLQVLQTSFSGTASGEQLFTFSPTKPARILTRYNDGSSNWYWTMLDAKSGRKIWARSFKGMQPRMIYSLDGRQLIVSSHSVARSDTSAKTFPLEILDPQTGKTLRKIQAQETVYATVISKQTLVTIGAETKTRRNSIRVYDWPSGRLKATNPYSGSGMLWALDVALSNDGRTLAILDGELEIFGIDKNGKTSEQHWNYYGDDY